jgi:hypothetical protein
MSAVVAAREAVGDEDAEAVPALAPDERRIMIVGRVSPASPRKGKSGAPDIATDTRLARSGKPRTQRENFRRADSASPART